MTATRTGTTFRERLLRTSLKTHLCELLASYLDQQTLNLVSREEELFGSTAEVIEILPRNPSAARIILCFASTVIYISLGAATTIELRLSDAAAESFLSNVIQAVSDGRFSEDLWIRGDQLVKSVGTLIVSSGAMKFRKRNLAVWPFGTQHLRIDYGPYLDL